MLDLLHDDGTMCYEAEFLMTISTVDDTQYVRLRVYLLVDTNHFIEFIHQNTYSEPGDPGDPGDKVIASYAQALLMYNNYLDDYELIITYDDAYICEEYFHIVDAPINCVEGRNEFIGAGGYNTFVSMIEIDVIDGDNFFEVTVDQYDPVLLTTETITYEFYAYVDPAGDVWMITINEVH